VNNRQASRYKLKVIHLHRVASDVARRVSELVMVKGQPNLVFGWVNLGSIRTPIFLPLDPHKLHRGSEPGVYHYSEITTDPQDTQALPQAPVPAEKR
jgi:hypothetical protein